MKRALIFLVPGPLFGVTLVSLAMALASNISWWPIFAVWIVQDVKTYTVIMALLAWLSDVVLVHWEVQRQVRMIVLGGAVIILTVALQRYSPMVLSAALICGAVAAFCVWLSDRP